MSKEFTGSWVIVIVLIILCWPAALIYFLALLQNHSDRASPVTAS